MPRSSRKKLSSADDEDHDEDFNRIQNIIALDGKSARNIISYSVSHHDDYDTWANMVKGERCISTTEISGIQLDSLDGCEEVSESKSITSSQNLDDSDDWTVVGTSKNKKDGKESNHKRETHYNKNYGSWADTIIVDDTTTTSKSPTKLLFSPRRSAQEPSSSPNLEKLKQKQDKAAELRDKIINEKSDKCRKMSKKIEVVRNWQNDMIEERRKTLEEKLQAAESRRQASLQQKIARAKDEELKGNEIAFINLLELSNKKHDLQTKEAESKARLEAFENEKKQKVLQKIAKEQAAETRRKNIEFERKQRIDCLVQKRKDRDERIEQKVLEKEIKRTESAKVRFEEIELRLKSLRANYEDQRERLQLKIETKQKTTAQRHTEQLQQIREKASEMAKGIVNFEEGELQPAARFEKKKFCSICKVILPTEACLLNHVRSSSHRHLISSNKGLKKRADQMECFITSPFLMIQEEIPNEEHGLEDELCRVKAIAKRCRKIRQQHANFASKIRVDSANNNSSNATGAKCLKEIEKIMNSTSDETFHFIKQKSMLSLERGIIEMAKLEPSFDDAIVDHLESVLTRLRNTAESEHHSATPFAPEKLLTCVCQCLQSLCSRSPAAWSKRLLHTRGTIVFDLLDYLAQACLNLSEAVLLNEKADYSLVMALCCTLSIIFGSAPIVATSSTSSPLLPVVAYVIASGVFDHVSQLVTIATYLTVLETDLARSLTQLFNFLTATLMMASSVSANSHNIEESTAILSTLIGTDMVGVMYLVYALLLNETSFESSQTLAGPTLPLLISSFQFLSWCATLKPTLIQKSRGWLQFTRVSKFCLQTGQVALIATLLSVLGFFCLDNQPNQVLISKSDLLETIAQLPIEWLTEPQREACLLISLAAICYGSIENTKTLAKQLSPKLIIALLSSLLETRQASGDSSSAVASSSSSRETVGLPSIDKRFPVKMWKPAIDFFQKTC